MREVRPTIKVLKSLPRNTFGDTTAVDLIENSDFQSLQLYGIDHPLLEDARRRFADGLPDQHKAATTAYGKPVFEVRDRQGAAWRGAVVLDADGDPWLVWAQSHDLFHRKVANTDFDNHMPSKVEYMLRDREEAATAAREWRTSLLIAFTDGLQACVQSGTPHDVAVPPLADQHATTLRVEAEEHDQPATHPDQAHLSETLLGVTLRLDNREPEQLRRAIQEVCLPFLQPDVTKVDAYFGKNGTFNASVVVSHARLAQVIADVPPHSGTPPRAILPAHRLHYVAKAYMAAGFVNGDPVRGVCGTWFVPSRGDEADLPICPECENEMPAAQTVLNLLRRHN